MEQNGPITAGTVERLIRWAKDERFRGSIDVRGDQAATLSFSAGFIAHIDTGEPEPPGAASDTKEQVQARLAGRLARLLEFDEGSYVIHPTAQLPAEARWLFSPMALVEAVAPARPRAPLPIRTNDAVVALDDRGVTGPVELSPDAIRTVVALGRAVPTSELRRRTGWDDDRLTRALGELQAIGLLRTDDPAPHPAADPDGPLLDLRNRELPRSPVGGGERRPLPSPDADASGASLFAARRPVPATGTDEPANDAGAASSRTRASALRRLIQNLR